MLPLYLIISNLWFYHPFDTFLHSMPSYYQQSADSRLFFNHFLHILPPRIDVFGIRLSGIQTNLTTEYRFHFSGRLARFEWRFPINYGTGQIKCPGGRLERLINIEGRPDINKNGLNFPTDGNYFPLQVISIPVPPPATPNKVVKVYLLRVI